MFKSRVHVMPFGNRLDLILNSAINTMADKVYLLVDGKNTNPKKVSGIKKISRELENNNISVLIINHEKDSTLTMRTIRQIIESEIDNEIYINVSSGTQIQAIAGYQSACYYKNSQNIHVYECDGQTDDKSTNESASSGIREISIIPVPSLSFEQIQALKLIVKNQKMKKTNLANELTKTSILKTNPGLGNERQVNVTSMNQNIINPLQNSGLIKTSKVGRSQIVEATEQGINTAIFLGHPVSLPENTSPPGISSYGLGGMN